MTDASPTIRPEATVIHVHDGDTYLMLLDLHGRGLAEDGCETVWVRLRDYSCRELTDTAATDPKGAGRVNGPAAQQIATKTFAAAAQITVELKGPDGNGAESFGRLVGWVYVDGQSLGEMLVAAHAAVAGKFVGDPNRHARS